MFSEGTVTAVCGFLVSGLFIGESVLTQSVLCQGSFFTLDQSPCSNNLLW